jgi:hypothetical protein
MSQKRFEIELGLIGLAYVAIVAAIAFLGPVLALITVALSIPVIATIALFATALAGALNETDRQCAETDRQLDQEAEARRTLRTQNTVTAQVIVFPRRRRTDGAA